PPVRRVLVGPEVSQVPIPVYVDVRGALAQRVYGAIGKTELYHAWMSALKDPGKHGVFVTCRQAAPGRVGAQSHPGSQTQRLALEVPAVRFSQEQRVGGPIRDAGSGSSRSIRENAFIFGPIDAVAPTCQAGAAKLVRTPKHRRIARWQQDGIGPDVFVGIRNDGMAVVPKVKGLGSAPYGSFFGRVSRRALEQLDA